jgi:hypothetical protein
MQYCICNIFIYNAFLVLTESDTFFSGCLLPGTCTFQELKTIYKTPYKAEWRVYGRCFQQYVSYVHRRVGLLHMYMYIAFPAVLSNREISIGRQPFYFPFPILLLSYILLKTAFLCSLNIYFSFQASPLFHSPSPFYSGFISLLVLFSASFSF